MSREIDSIPFYNKEKQLIASYNVYMKMLYLSWRITEEEREEVYNKLEKKRYKGYSIMESNPHNATTENNTKENIITEDVAEDEEELITETVEEAPKKRHRRTKAEMEAARAQEAKAKTAPKKRKKKAK